MNRRWISIGDIKFYNKCPFARRMPNGHIVGCGHCYYCRKKMAKELAFRCEEEAFDKYVYNVLLTYADDSLPYRNGKMTLNKVHFQDFMKRFRDWFYREYGFRLRYLCVGEYGGKKGRPHYHMILFTDISLLDKDRDYDEKHRRVPYAFIQSRLDFFWRKGVTDIEPMNNVGGSVRYLTQYMLTHTKDDEDKQIEKPFRLMSRGRGLGYKWLERTKELQSRCVATNEFLINGKPIPRYYIRKFIPEALQAERTLESFYSSADYTTYIKSLSRHEEDFEKYREFDRERKESIIRQGQRAYREAKIHDNNRSATRFFARNGKARKGRAVPTDN